MPKEMKYTEAVARLDDILSQIEDDDVDIDELAIRVKEAVELLKVCKAKVDKAELEVKKVVDDLSRQDKDMGDR